MSTNKKKNPLNSKAILTLTSGEKYLNGCLTPQRYYVSIELTDPEGKHTRIALSLDQFAHLLVSNSMTDCTFVRYLSEDGTMKAEEVPTPESVQQRFKNSLGDVHKENMDRLLDLEQIVFDIVNGNRSGGKRAMQEVLHEIKVFKSNYSSNEAYVIHKAQEDVDKIQNNMRAQLTALFGVPDEKIRLLEGTGDVEVKLLGEVAANTTGYKRKTSKAIKPIDDMTTMEVAEELNGHLRRLEMPNPPGTCLNLYMSSATHSAGSVQICYVSYQGHRKASLDVAKKFLAHIRDVKDPSNLKRHWDFED